MACRTYHIDLYYQHRIDKNVAPEMVAHTMRKGDLMIVRKGKLVEKIAPDSQFRVMVVYVSAPFIGLSTPQSNYGVKGRLALFLNPIMHLNSSQFEQCIRNFNDLQCRLCVTSKYLSEVSKSACGYSANFWINRYTSLEISRLLRDKSLSFVQISDMLNFSSPAYFSRYVLHNLGVNPTEYRG